MKVCSKSCRPLSLGLTKKVMGVTATRYTQLQSSRAGVQVWQDKRSEGEGEGVSWRRKQDLIARLLTTIRSFQRSKEVYCQ